MDLMETAEEHHLKPSDRKKVSIDCLAPELLHMIFPYLKSTEAASLRLVSRNLALIGLHYLVSAVTLIVTKDSYDRLLAMSEHPFVSQLVTALSYHTDPLKVLEEPEWVDHLRQSSSFLVLNPSYQTYQGYCAEHQPIIQSNFHAAKIAAAMRELPNLKTIKISCGGEDYSSTRNFNRAFGVQSLVCYNMFQRDLPIVPRGVRQVRTLCRIINRIGLQIETLQCTTVSWRILQQGKRSFKAMKKVVRGVRDLHLSFSTRKDLEYGLCRNSSETKADECAKYIRQSGRAHKLFKSAPALRSLAIGFDDIHLAVFGHVVGNIRWLSLAKVSFYGLAASDFELGQFVERHASTLKDVSFANMKLKGGTWEMFVYNMCKGVVLDKFRLAGAYSVIHTVYGTRELLRADDFSFSQEDPILNPPGSTIARAFYLGLAAGL